MAFRYLSESNSKWTPGGARSRSPDSSDRFENVRQRLLTIAGDTEDALDIQQEGEAYGVIMEQLLEYTPPDERRTTVWRLAKSLPRSFRPIVGYVIRNCP